MKYIVAVLILFSPFCALSQSNYHKGSVTNNNGETIAGYIDLREWDNNPKYIDFKTAIGDKKAQKVYPAAVKSLVIDDIAKYYSYAGRISTNRISLPNLPIGKDTSSISDTVFLKQITTGNNVTLYTYTDNIKTRFFVQEKQQRPYELFYQQYLDESGTNTRTVNQYTGQLSLLISKYTSNAKLLDKTEKLTYSIGDIQDIITGINGNNIAKKTKSNTRFYAGVGLNINVLHFSGSYDVSAYNSSTVYSPRLSLGVDIFNNPDAQSLIFRAELSTDYVDPQFTKHDSDGSTTTYIFKQYNVSVTPQIIWNIYNKETFKFYIDGGLGFVFSGYANQSFTITHTGYAIQGYIPPPLSKVWFKFPIQVGAVFNKRIEVFASATAGSSSYTNETSYSLHNQIYSAGIHLLLGKN